MARLHGEKAETVLETIEQVLAALVQMPGRDHALDALITAIETDRDRLLARLRERPAPGFRAA